MDASSLKRNRGGEIGPMEDMGDKGRGNLSELPDNVLSHILSFLPTKEAVRTSILSKRWEYLWTSIPKLHFVHETEPLMDFVNIVDRSLQLRGSSDITSFYLDCRWHRLAFESRDVDIMPKIESWISDVVRFNVQYVELNLFASPFTLPFTFVNCRTLASLTILGGGMPLEFPSPVCFSNLKKLELDTVEFPVEHSPQQLFSGCPLLEDLKLERCNWENVTADSMSVVSPRLQYFTMIEDIEQLPPSFSGHEFVISGSGLKYFHYEGLFQFDFVLNSQLLEEVLIKNFSS